MLKPIGVLTGTVAGREELSGGVSGAAQLDGEIGVGEGFRPDKYDGPYEVVPGDEPVTLDTGDKLLSQDIVVQPIPSNYGRITWDGYTLTVS